MTSGQRDRVKELLIEVLEQPVEKRADVLNAICPDDPIVRAEIERLLALSDEMGGFLERPALSLARDARPGECAGITLDGRYVLESYLGGGGFGEVYKAQDATIGRTVAVKLLYRGVLSETTLRQEIKALATVEHPGIVGILDAGKAEDGRYYLVLRHVSGPTLRALLSTKKPLPASMVKRLAGQLAEALYVAHRLGVLHLDLKPENIIIRDAESPEAQAVILDFGVGAHVGHLEFRSVVTSTSCYQAPELARGESSPQSDLYSLGAVLFEILTDTRFENEQSLTRVPRSWRAILSRLLAREPSARFRSATEVHSAINGLGRGRWKVVTASAILLLGLIAFFFQGRSTPARHVARPIPFTSLQGEESFPCFSADGSRLYFSWAREDAGNSEIYVKDLAGGELVRLTSHPAKEISATNSPDGKLIAFLRNRREGRNALIVMPSSGGQEAELGEGFFDSITWSPVQSVIAVAVSDEPESPQELRLLNVETGTWERLFERSGAVLVGKHPAFSPDGRNIVFVRKPERGRTFVYAISIDQRMHPTSEPRLLTPAYADVWRPQWTRDAKNVVYAAGPGANRTLWAVPADASRPPHPIPEAGDRVSSLALSRTAEDIVYGFRRADSNIWRLDLDSERHVLRKKPLITSTFEDEEQQLSSDGTKLAFISQRSGSEQVWLADSDGGQQKQITHFTDSDNLQVYWAPDSKTLLVAGVFKLRRHSYLVSPTEGPAAEIGPGLDDAACGWSRDGKWVYFNSANPSRPGLWKIELSSAQRVHVTDAVAVKAVESFDGQMLYYCTRRYSEGIWAMPVSGGAATKIIPAFTRRAFAVSREGIFYVSSGNQPGLLFHLFAGKTDTEILSLQQQPWFGLDATPDGRTVLVTQIDHDSVDLMIIHGFRP